MGSTYIYRVFSSSLISILYSLLSSSPLHYQEFYPPCAPCFHQLHLHHYDFKSSTLTTFKMHFSTFLTAATALCATTASAGCFKTGEHWGNHDDAKAALKYACSQAPLTGPYNTKQPKDACENGPSGSNKSYKFQTNNSGRNTVSQADCENHIGGIIDTCGRGGDLTVDGVYYRYI